MPRALTLTRLAVAAILGGVLLWRMLSTYGGGGYSERWRTKGDLPAVGPLLAPDAMPKRSPIADSLTVVVAAAAGTSDSGFAANITVTNSSAATVKEVVLDCAGLGSSGAVIGHTRTVLHDVFRPHRTNAVAHVTLPFLQRNVTGATCTAMSLSTER